jgi:RNA polymerase sigma-70 factor (ECF subfamily)
MAPESRKSTIAAFFRDEYARMVAFVRSRIEDAADRDGEDIVQDVMESVFSLADFTVPLDDLASYVYRSLKNRVIDAMRRRKRQVSLDMPVGEDDATLADFLADVRYDAVRESDKREMRDRLFAAIDSLGADQRAIILLTEFEGRTFAEVSAETGVPIGTLLARKSRAMKRIRELLSGENIGLEDIDGSQEYRV